MLESLQEANLAIDSILAYRLPPGRSLGQFDEHYRRLDDDGRHALFLAVCGRLLVEMERRRHGRPCVEGQS